MKTETKAHLLPWTIGGGANVVSADGQLVTSVPRPKGAGAPEKRDATAVLIVRAVNAHEEMLEALHLLRPSARGPGCWCANHYDTEAHGHSPTCLKTRAAIAKAEGRS